MLWPSTRARRRISVHLSMSVSTVSPRVVGPAMGSEGRHRGPRVASHAMGASRSDRPPVMPPCDARFGRPGDARSKCRSQQLDEEEKKPCPICGEPAGGDPGPSWCDRWGCNKWHCADHDCTPCLVCDRGPVDGNTALGDCERCGFYHCDSCGCPDPEWAQERLDWLEAKINGW